MATTWRLPAIRPCSEQSGGSLQPTNSEHTDEKELSFKKGLALAVGESKVGKIGPNGANGEQDRVVTVV